MIGKSVFTNLPSELQSLLVTDWLEWTEVGRYDIAMCNRTSRKVWLNLLSNRCVFNSISSGHWGYPPFFRWCLLRSIRARDVFIGMCPLFSEETVAEWFQHTGPFLTTLTFHQIKDFVKDSLVRYCSRLHVLSIERCILDDTIWEILRNNSTLQELHLVWCRDQRSLFPNNITLPSLQKLELDGDCFNSVDTVAFLQLLPSLRSIKFHQSFITVANDALSTANLPNLVHMHVDCYFHSKEDHIAQTFLMVMKSLTLGLRCLVLPAYQTLASIELLSIAQYHGCSLRCLSIQNNINWNERYTDIDFVEQLNQMPLLHTLQLTYESLSTLPSLIVNLSVTHLYLDFHLSLKSCSIKDAISTHCPMLSTLSIFWPSSYYQVDMIISDISLLLESRPRIRKLCVNDDDILAELRKELPHICVVKSTPIDIFTTDY